MVGLVGNAPTTFAMSMRHSTFELKARNFFNKNYSLIGAAIFSFEPRLILDSLSGTNLTPFILLFVLSLLFFLSKNPKIILLSFVFTAFSTLVRYEGILLLIPLSIIYFNRFGKSPKKILHYIIMISIFILILTPIVHFRYQTDGNDGISRFLLIDSVNEDILLFVITQ